MIPTQKYEFCPESPTDAATLGLTDFSDIKTVTRKISHFRTSSQAISRQKRRF